MHPHHGVVIMKRILLATLFGLASVELVARVPTVALAFTFVRPHHHRHAAHHDDATSTSPSNRNSKPTAPCLFMGRTGYSSMPPLSIPSLSIPHLSIFKIFKRNDVYPTVDIPIEEENNDSGNYTSIDDYFMGMALQQAQRAWNKGEVPIGALIVRECTDDCFVCEGQDEHSTIPTPAPTSSTRTFQILSASHNRVETNMDASAHAELLALRKGALRLQNWRYPPNSRLYSTLEPCPMCLASIQAFRIDHIVYGAPDNRLGAINTHMNLLQVAKHPYHEIKSVTSGVREEECGDVMVQFFRERREQSKLRKKAEKAKKNGGDDTSTKQLLKLPLKKTSGKKGSRLARLVKRVLRRE